MKNILSTLLALVFMAGCGAKKQSEKQDETKALSAAYDTTGSIERIDPAIDEIIPSDAEIEILGEGFNWSEGPVWVAKGEYLLFSDVPENKVYKWKEGEGVSEYLSPSGYTGEMERSGEGGSNGLLLDKDGNLVLCQHGDRRVARMNTALDAPKAEYITLAGVWNDKKFNSPNDAAYDSKGDLYFTDPPYGLPGQDESPDKEIDFSGVFRLTTDGQVDLLTEELNRPNGIAFSPDEKKLYVANSDPERAIWMVYNLNEEGLIESGQLLYDATEWVPEAKGLPDGLKVDGKGNVFATGPGGVWVFGPEGTLLGRILTGEATANCAFSEDGKTLYMTADMYLMRLEL
jgi:gluconolactonase